MRKHVYGYTMVEILMVIVIAAILFGIGIPAFSTLIRGNAMTVSIRQLTAKIQAARSYAVTNRCYVAIVFPTDETQTDATDNRIKRSFPYMSFRPCKVTTDGTNLDFDSWIDGEDWHRFPVGIIIGKDAADFTNGYGVKGCDIRDIINKPVTSSKTTDFSRALIFKPDGQLKTSASGDPVIRLANGRYVPDVTPPVVFTERENDKVVYHPVSVSQYTGKMTVLPAIAP